MVEVSDVGMYLELPAVAKICSHTVTYIAGAQTLSRLAASRASSVGTDRRMVLFLPAYIHCLVAWHSAMTLSGYCSLVNHLMR
jgi:hypothetical protein